jgi:hypothetical protein
VDAAGRRVADTSLHPFKPVGDSSDRFLNGVQGEMKAIVGLVARRAQLGDFLRHAPLMDV